MSRYIDADMLQEAMYHESMEIDTDMQKWESGCWIRYKLFTNVLEKQPTADVAPVKHGTWEDASVKTYGEFAVHKYGKGFYECSCCHEIVWLASRFNYCPQCGARMDGE